MEATVTTQASWFWKCWTRCICQVEKPWQQPHLAKVTNSHKAFLIKLQYLNGGSSTYTHSLSPGYNTRKYIKVMCIGIPVSMGSRFVAGVSHILTCCWAQISWSRKSKRCMEHTQSWNDHTNSSNPSQFGHWIACCETASNVGGFHYFCLSLFLLQAVCTQYILQTQNLYLPFDLDSLFVSEFVK